MNRLQFLLRECAKRKDAPTGMRLHGLLVFHGLESLDAFGALLILFYARCGRLLEAHECFHRIHGSCSLHTWNLLISAHLKLGSSDMVLRLYTRMSESGHTAAMDNAALTSTLQACVNSGSLREGLLLHSHVFEHTADHGRVIDSKLASSFIAFYSMLGCLADAESVFNSFRGQDLDVNVLGSMMYAYLEHGREHSSIELYESMRIQGLEPNHFVLNSLVKACKSSLDRILKVHDQIVRNYYESDLVIGTSLLDAYAKLGELDGASRVFKGLSSQDVVSWGVLIDGHMHCGHAEEALNLFHEVMGQNHLNPDLPILLSVVIACTQVRNARKGRLIHGMIIENKYESHAAIASSLIRMYAACGHLPDAHQTFGRLQDRDIISLGAIMAGYLEHGECQSVINLCNRMQDEEGQVGVDKVVLMSLIGACSGVGDIRLGLRIHDRMIRNDSLWFDEVDIGNALVNMYMKCGAHQEAQHVFDHIPARNLVAWGAMVAGYVQEGYVSEAFGMFASMLHHHIEPDEGLYACILKACALTGVASKIGRWLHDRIIRHGFDNIPIVTNATVYMYASCGGLEEAYKVLNGMANKDVVSWSSLITGLALNGSNVRAEKLLVGMRVQGIAPDDALYATLMSSYTHRGLVKESLLSLKKNEGDIKTTSKLYNCLIDLFSRTGQLLEAKDLLRTMPSLPGGIACSSMLANSRTYGDCTLSKAMFESNVCRPNHKSEWLCNLARPRA